MLLEFCVRGYQAARRQRANADTRARENALPFDLRFARISDANGPGVQPLVRLGQLADLDAKGERVFVEKARWVGNSRGQAQVGGIGGRQPGRIHRR